MGERGYQDREGMDERERSGRKFAATEERQVSATGIALWALDGISVVAAGFAVRSALQAVRSARRVREIRRSR